MWQDVQINNKEKLIIPIFIRFFYMVVAQLVAHLLWEQVVGSSSLPRSSNGPLAQLVRAADS